MAAEPRLWGSGRQKSLQRLPLRISEAAWIGGFHTVQDNSCHTFLPYKTLSQSLTLRRMLRREELMSYTAHEPCTHVPGGTPHYT
jgi:hypothetical protein